MIALTPPAKKTSNGKDLPATRVLLRNAIISCHNKEGLPEFVSQLLRISPQLKIFSSSGTYRALEPVAKNNLVDISDYTGFKEMPSGLVKTLHPKIHSGILADIEDPEQQQYLNENRITVFDLIIVNLYPFEQAVKENAGFETTRQNIDIGGVSLLEAASKNFLRVAVIAKPEDYHLLLESLKANNGGTDLATRLQLAQTAVSYLAAYLETINRYLKTVHIEDIHS